MPSEQPTPDDDSTLDPDEQESNAAYLPYLRGTPGESQWFGWQDRGNADAFIEVEAETADEWRQVRR